MNRLPVTAITSRRPMGWRGAALPAQGGVSQQMGLPVSVAYCHNFGHDFGRESDDATTSGEGHG